jgi:hypothetical protein
MSLTQEAYKGVLAGVRPLLKQQGFSKKGNAFRRICGEVVHLVVFQRSTGSTSSRIKFAVNLGAASIRLLAQSSRDPARCEVWDCHWRTRLKMDGETSEKWWTISDPQSAQIAASEVAHALEKRGLLALDGLSSDAAFRDMWLAGHGNGLTEGMELLNLVILLRALGPPDQYQVVAERLRTLATAKHWLDALDTLKELEQ